MTTLRIGTRRSTLAMAQAEEIRRLLAEQDVSCELVPMTTSGDEGARPAGRPAGLKGLFVDAILDALAEGRIDAAVHSAKDLPAEDAEGFVLAAVPARADPLDVLVTRRAELPPAAVIGTSSLRRRAQLLRAFPGIHVEDLRGNVDTRLRKLGEGVVDALVLAAAGLARLGVKPAHAAPLSADVMLPAPGQGAIALQAREDDGATIATLASLDHPPSHTALDAERSLMWRLAGGCTLPLGALATADAGQVLLQAAVLTPDGARMVRATAESGSAEGAAATAAKLLIDQGAEEILAQVGEAT